MARFCDVTLEARLDNSGTFYALLPVDVQNDDRLDPTELLCSTILAFETAFATQQHGE